VRLLVFSAPSTRGPVKQLNETAHYNLLVRFGKAEPVEQVEPENDASPEIQRELSEGENQEKGVNSE